MLIGSQIVAQACADAHQPNATTVGQNKLQIILDECCYKHDFALARGVYNFFLNPATITTINGVTNFGGPYPLPLDYLRTSASSGSDGVQYSFFYYFNGVPYPLRPWDLGRLDMQVQQAGIQNLPYAFATDVSPESTAQDRLAGTTTAATTSGSPVITVATSANILNGMSVAGLGIAPGAVITNIAGPSLTLSLNCTGTFPAAPIMFGTPVNAYVYPGPSGSFPTVLRYQRLMPPLLDFTRIPWFPDQDFLLTRLTADMMATTDDTRWDAFQGRARMLIGEYETFADDKTNRAQTVLLDRNRFGRNFQRLPNTK